MNEIESKLSSQLRKRLASFYLCNLPNKLGAVAWYLSLN